MGTPREDAIALAKQKLSEAQDGALNDAFGSVYDQALVDHPEGSGITQSDLDAAKQAGKDEQLAADQAQISAIQAQDDADKQALIDAKAAFDVQIADLQKKLDDMTAKEQAEEAVIEGLKDSKEKLQAAADLIASLFPVVVPPPPVEEPPVEEPAPEEPAPSQE